MTFRKGLEQFTNKRLIYGSIFLICATNIFTSATTRIISCPSMDRQITKMQNINISSTTSNSYTTTEIPKPVCPMSPSLRFNDTYSAVNATELLPNWNEPVLDLCHDSETILIITEPFEPHDEQEIRCPERVTGLSMFVALTDSELQAFLDKFCQIMQISFVGEAVCRLPNESGIQKEMILAQNLQAISFEELENCSEFYKGLGDSLIARRLTSVAFKCTSFEKEELQGLEYFFRRQGTPKRIKCSNENACADLDLSINRKTILNYSIVTCL